MPSEKSKNENVESLFMNSVLTTEEVLKMRHIYLEEFIVRNSELIGKNLTLCSRRTWTPEGFFDLWFENKDKDIVIVELKLKRIGKRDLHEVQDSVRCLRERFRRAVHLIVVCKDVSSTIVHELRKQKDIQVFCFGWKLLVYPRKWD
jgi:RecB family endonuclease NucS